MQFASAFKTPRAGGLALAAFSVSLMLMGAATLSAAQNSAMRGAELAQATGQLNARGEALGDAQAGARRTLSEDGFADEIPGAVPVGQVVAVFDRGFVYNSGDGNVVRCAEGWWTTDAAQPCTYPRKSQAVAFLLSLSLGWLGVDQFYAGNMALGATKFVFFVPTCGIWGLVDVILWARGTHYLYDANGVPMMPWGFNLPADADPRAIWLAAYL